MKRQVDIREISDGKLYGAGDMVKADTGGCAGCSACCRGMENSVILDPYDIWRLEGALGLTFEQLLEDKLELQVVDGIILPNLRMTGPEEACAFLTGEGRCGIHSARPGVCRLFPLGRYYEGRDFRYFLQVHECPRENRAKVKVRKWIDTPGIGVYEDYIRQWHYFLEDVEAILERDGSQELRRQVNLFLMKLFFAQPWETEKDFYPQFAERLRQGKQYAGIAG